MVENVQSVAGPADLHGTSFRGKNALFCMKRSHVATACLTVVVLYSLNSRSCGNEMCHIACLSLMDD